jgi:hypothetical protein
METLKFTIFDLRYLWHELTIALCPMRQSLGLLTEKKECRFTEIFSKRA